MIFSLTLLAVSCGDDDSGSQEPTGSDGDKGNDKGNDNGNNNNNNNNSGSGGGKQNTYDGMTPIPLPSK